MHQHMEMIVQRAKDSQDGLPAELDFAFGPENTGATLLLAAILRDAQQNLTDPWFHHPEAGGVVAAALNRTIALLIPGARIFGFSLIDSSAFWPVIDPSPFSTKANWEMRVALCMRPVYQLRDFLVGDRPGPARAVDSAIIGRLTDEQKQRIKDLEPMVPERAMALAWKASSMSDEAIAVAWKASGMPDKEITAWLAWLNTEAVGKWLKNSATSTPTAPRTAAAQPDSVTPDHPEYDGHRHFPTAWQLARLRALNQWKREPSEIEIAEVFAVDGELKYLCALHRTPQTAASILTYRRKLLAESQAAQETDTGPQTSAGVIPMRRRQEKRPTAPTL
jgi:hypothetical protein